MKRTPVGSVTWAAWRRNVAWVGAELASTRRQIDRWSGDERVTELADEARVAIRALEDELAQRDRDAARRESRRAS